MESRLEEDAILVNFRRLALISRTSRQAELVKPLKRRRKFLGARYSSTVGFSKISTATPLLKNNRQRMGGGLSLRLQDRTFSVRAIKASFALAFPFKFNNATDGIEKRDTIYSSSTGYSGGYYYSLWEQNNAGVTMNIGQGQYSLTWNSQSQDVVAGIGWNPGSAHGSFNPGGNSYLSLYGWTTNPLVEYYICDNFGDYNPSTGTQHVGTVNSDGGTYDIYRTQRVNAPSIQGTATFNQYWSVRQQHRVGGTISTGTHFNAWNSLGMQMGQFNYQILATEGYGSTGSSQITLGQAPASSSSAPPSSTYTPPPSSTSTPTSTPTSGGGGGTSAHWGQCGGLGWTGPTACESPYTCQVGNLPVSWRTFEHAARVNSS
ncbi:hypothetical protein D9619_011511 [Psilocybe cf. subviscida]|uniref:Endo-1,4-beta-xylanase n=1 Tax=Psilocybe cf. subviscida TaxID=2480587 RepID=A0A8H5BSD1_9AGAR|nr:hypothetical protein D9619_011511 [Psilocybe cf. subviscida]